MSNAECVKRYQQKQKKRLEDAERKLEYATQLLRDIEARLQSGDADFPSLGYDIECRMHEVLHDKP